MSIKPVKFNESTKKFDVRYRYKDSKGKSHSTMKRGFETEELALKFYYTSKLKNLDHTKIKMIFKDLYLLFIEDCELYLKYSTIEGYNYLYKKYLSIFDSTDINKITFDILDKYIKDLYFKEIGSKRINKIIALLKIIFTYGNNKLDINYDPTAKLEKVKSFAKEDEKVNFFTLSEFNQFINSFTTDDYLFKVAFMILFYCGLRVGELQALDLSDVDLTNNVIHVNKNYMRKPAGKYEIVKTKTSSSNSVVHIPKVLKNELIKYINMYRLKQDDPLFSYNKDRLKKRTIENYKNRYCDIAGVKRIRIHDFRHSFASLVYELSNYNYSEVAKRLRHKDTSTVMKTYIHVFPTRKNEVDNKLDSL